MGFLQLHSLTLLAQEDGAAPQEPWFLHPAVLILAIGLMFYFLMIRPEKRKRAQTAEMLERLKKNDRVVTVGGIYGVVVNAPKDDEYVMLRVDDNSNTKLRVLRSAISRVIGDQESEETSKVERT